MAAQATTTAEFTGVSNVTYDLLTMLTNKLQCVAAVEQYRKDAEQEGADEVLFVFAQIERHAKEDITALRRLIGERI